MKTCWYVLSMLPLYIVVAILSWKLPLCWPWEDYQVMELSEIIKELGFVNVLILLVCIVLFLASCIIAVCLHNKLKGSTSGIATIEEVTNVSWDMMSFVASFFFPVVSYNLSERTSHAIVLLLLYIMIGRIFILSDKYYSNPTLLLMGYYILSVNYIEKDQSNRINRDVTLISRDKLKKGDKFTFLKIDENTYYAQRYI